MANKKKAGLLRPFAFFLVGVPSMATRFPRSGLCCPNHLVSGLFRLLNDEEAVWEFIKAFRRILGSQGKCQNPQVP
ncbi:MAG: hypothetical protein H7839_14925 [Magnetococcus sp. YQC-5]